MGRPCIRRTAYVEYKKVIPVIRGGGGNWNYLKIIPKISGLYRAAINGNAHIQSASKTPDRF
jgi:hypothetical protein